MQNFVPVRQLLVPKFVLGRQLLVPIFVLGGQLMVLKFVCRFVNFENEIFLPNLPTSYSKKIPAVIGSLFIAPVLYYKV